MRRMGGREIADGRKHRILARAALRIARDRPGAVVDDTISVRQRLDRFVLDGGGIRRARHRSAGGVFEGPAYSNGDGAGTFKKGAGPGLLRYPNFSVLLREYPGRGHEKKNRESFDGYSFHGRGGLLSNSVSCGLKRICCAEPSGAMVTSAVKLTPSGTAPGGRSEEHTSELQSRGHLVCR